MTEPQDAMATAPADPWTAPEVAPPGQEAAISEPAGGISAAPVDPWADAAPPIQEFNPSQVDMDLDSLAYDGAAVGNLMVDPTALLTNPSIVLNTLAQGPLDTVRTIGDIAPGTMPTLSAPLYVMPGDFSPDNLPGDVSAFGQDATAVGNIAADPAQLLTDPGGVMNTLGQLPTDAAKTIGDLEAGLVPPTSAFSNWPGMPTGMGSPAVASVSTPTETIVPTQVSPTDTAGGALADSDNLDAATLDPGGDFSTGMYGDLEPDLADAGSGVDAGGQSLLGEIGSAVPLGAVGGAVYDVAEGNYDGAIAEGVIGGADIAGEALGLPGFDGDVGLVTDLIDGNTGAIEGDAEKAGIETAASIAGGVIGSVIGPEGTVVGAAIGNFVGAAIAPTVEKAVGQTIDNAEDLGSDTVDALSGAGTDLSDGNVLGAVGDLATGAVEDVGDVATEAVDLTGDAVEGVGDVLSATAGVVGDVGDGIEDVADDIGDGIDDLGDDIESLF